MPPKGSGFLPDDNYPDWLTFNDNGSSVTFKVPQVDGRSLKTIMCVVYSSSPDDITSEGLKVMLVINCTKNTIQLYKRDALLASSDEEEWQRIVSNTEPGDIVKVLVVFGHEFIVKKTSVYLIYDEPIDQKAKHCLEPDKNITFSSGDGNVSNIGLNLPMQIFYFCFSHCYNERSQGRLTNGIGLIVNDMSFLIIYYFVIYSLFLFVFEFRYMADSSSDFLPLFEPF